MTEQSAGRGPYTGKWFDERNKRRRERYKKDPAYREKTNTISRNGYRDAVGTILPTDPAQNLHMLDRGPTLVGTVRTMKDGTKNRITFSKAELALVFDRSVKQVQQWASGSDTRIPSPIHKARVEGVERVWLDVYTQQEARAIVTTLAPYLKDLLYFRADHKEAIEACRAAVARVRREANNDARFKK